MTNTIIYDFNQTVISTVSAGSKYFKEDLTIEMLRHMILNNILTYRKKYPEYKNVIIACDGPNSWRRRYFSYYKASRRKSRDESPIDWNLVYQTIDLLEKELTEYFPYKVVRVDGAEGDDIIAVLVKHLQEEYDGLSPPLIKIISSDKDFRQLQVFPGVSQFSSIEKKEIAEPDPEKYLFEMILKGDRGDGVPNFLSEDDCFVMGVRQRQLRQTRIDQCWNEKDPQVFCSTDELMKYTRNKKMVDLVHNEIPEDIVSAILDAYKNAPVAKKERILTYCVEYRLNNIASNLQYF